MTSLIEYAVQRACERFQHNGHEFNTANFQQELSRLTDSRPMVTMSHAEVILLSVPGVERTASCYWSYKP